MRRPRRRPRRSAPGTCGRSVRPRPSGAQTATFAQGLGVKPPNSVHRQFEVSGISAFRPIHGASAPPASFVSFPPKPSPSSPDASQYAVARAIRRSRNRRPAHARRARARAHRRGGRGFRVRRCQPGRGAAARVRGVPVAAPARAERPPPGRRRGRALAACAGAARSGRLDPAPAGRPRPLAPRLRRAPERRPRRRGCLRALGGPRHADRAARAERAPARRALGARGGHAPVRAPAGGAWCRAGDRDDVARVAGVRAGVARCGRCLLAERHASGRSAVQSAGRGHGRRLVRRRRVRRGRRRRKRRGERGTDRCPRRRRRPPPRPRPRRPRR